VRHYDDKLPRVKSDPLLLHQVFLNMVMNAEHAIAAGGQNGRIEIGTAVSASGDRIVAIVRDTGIGIPEDTLSRIFEPFYTTKEVGKGTGLGLSQVYGFAKQSGGAARIESQVGKGTTVRIFIPRADGQVVAGAALHEGLHETPPAAATILVVEDDPDVREIIVGILSDLGYRTLVATNGPEALAILNRENPVDLLFTDIVMPAGMSGTELARQASRLRPELKVLLSSGYTREANRWRSAAVEFPFIAKPYRPTTLRKNSKKCWQKVQFRQRVTARARSRNLRLPGWREARGTSPRPARGRARRRSR
jgi:CheY-like chemotaxis protein